MSRTASTPIPTLTALSMCYDGPEAGYDYQAERTMSRVGFARDDGSCSLRAGASNIMDRSNRTRDLQCHACKRLPTLMISTLIVRIEGMILRLRLTGTLTGTTATRLEPNQAMRMTQATALTQATTLTEATKITEATKMNMNKKTTKSITTSKRATTSQHTMTSKDPRGSWHDREGSFRWDGGTPRTFHLQITVSDEV
ncbi:hypothetical protein LTR36_006763 [Oleoguttula mirabilis]|uniref:Uncharacterized protein n=1 Tax=Oleoguttula mirabilis TaxID=1507867 RepID=A0AAV9JBM7_9PEZI|nr:hypothetical protein LTR36_006763 [Oleoguttula mirabilis]